MKQYRAPFFEKLDKHLRSDDIRLTVAYSGPTAAESQKKDTCELPMEYGLKVKGFWLWPERLLYQPLLRMALRSDLVIVEQANRNLLNHILVPLSRLGLRRVAFWGHGTNCQPEQIPLSEWYRRKMLNWASWWFAYTRGTGRYLESQGVPASKITAVQNSVDTQEIWEHVRRLTERGRTTLRAKLDIPATASVGIFCGMLDKTKELPFLIESSGIIKSRISDYHLIMVGGGPEQEGLQRLTEGKDWVHWVGPRFGKEKAELLAISDAFLLPGRVGLAILDAFAAGLPMVTTRFKFHAPEIEYLEDGVNGLMTDHEVGTYADGVSSLLVTKDSLAELQAGARSSAEMYSIENMVDNFGSGVRSCLGLGVRKREAPEFQEAI